MSVYKNISGKSSILKFYSNDDNIIIMFKDGKLYKYSYYKAGKIHVENMKKLAEQGFGLNSYILKHARFLYD